jgi:hypothetical protein
MYARQKSLSLILETLLMMIDKGLKDMRLNKMVYLHIKCNVYNIFITRESVR